MFLVTKAFVRGMIRRKQGSIVNIGSLAGMRMLEVPVHYATAKSAVVGFTLALARELGRYNIRVNAVAPGMLTAGVSVNVPDKAAGRIQALLCPVASRPARGSRRIGGFFSQRSGKLYKWPGNTCRWGHLMKFRMVDRILAWEARRMIRGIKTVSFEEYELKERLGDEPCLPESLLMESLFQLGNWLVILSSDFSQMGMVVRLEEVQFDARLASGRSIEDRGGSAQLAR